MLMNAFIVWNVCGVANKDTMSHLKYLVNFYNLSFIALLESIIPFSKTANLRKTLGLPKFCPMRMIVVKFRFVLRMIYIFLLFYLQNNISLHMLIGMIFLPWFLLCMLNAIPSLENLYEVLYLI